MNASIILLAAMTCGQTFTVTNRMPQFTVVNKCQPCSLCDGDCRCKVCDCVNLEKRLANPPTWTPKAKMTAFSSVAQTQTVITTRAPSGHTHTCTTCGATWDHRENDTHKCKFCGGSPPTETRTDRFGRVSVVYLSDSPARPVTVRKTVQVASTPEATAPTQTTITLQTLQRSVSGSSACATGQCGTVATSRGFFRR